MLLTRRFRWSALALSMAMAGNAVAGADQARAESETGKTKTISRPALSNVMKDHGFKGVLLTGFGEANPILMTSGPALPSRFVAEEYEKRVTALAPSGGAPPFDRRASWRWASVTKQVVATLIMQEVATGRISLERTVAEYLPRFGSASAAKIRIADLLRHQSGLPNPDESPRDKEDVPAFYSRSKAFDRSLETGWCAGMPKAPPGGNVEYNNCDFLVAGAVLEAVTGKRWDQLVAERIAKPLKLTTVGAYPKSGPSMRGFDGDKREPDYQLEHFGAAGALFGSPLDLWKFDRALMNGKLLPADLRDRMWDGKAELGYAALGQWAFPARPEGCAAPFRIIERRGAIGAVQVRNLMVPEHDLVIIAFTNRAEFDFGEIWQDKGFSHDLLKTLLCPKTIAS